MKTKARTKESLGREAEMPLKVNCPFCGKELSVRWDKQDKPYLVCDDCQCQCFIRGDKGADNLEKIIEGEKKWGE